MELIKDEDSAKCKLPWRTIHVPFFSVPFFIISLHQPTNPTTTTVVVLTTLARAAIVFCFCFFFSVSFFFCVVLTVFRCYSRGVVFGVVGDSQRHYSEKKTTPTTRLLAGAVNGVWGLGASIVGRHSAPIYRPAGTLVKASKPNPPLSDHDTTPAIQVPFFLFLRFLFSIYIHNAAPPSSRRVLPVWFIFFFFFFFLTTKFFFHSEPDEHLNGPKFSMKIHFQVIFHWFLLCLPSNKTWYQVFFKYVSTTFWLSLFFANFFASLQIP